MNNQASLMLFQAESDLQRLIFKHPEYILGGIPELALDDSYKLYPIGREISLASGYLDNLFIDQNGVLTLVECKLSSNGSIKRDVYSQIINYAADLQSECRNNSTEEVIRSFNSILERSIRNNLNSKNNSKKEKKDDIVEMFNVIVNKEDNLKIKDISECTNEKYCEDVKKESETSKNKDVCVNCCFENWSEYICQEEQISSSGREQYKKQFKEGFANNIMNGYMRLIIYIAPKEYDVIRYNHLSNLMNLMSFSENKNNNYELLCMVMQNNYPASITETSSLKDNNENKTFLRSFGLVQIAWRSYTKLPELPKIKTARHKNQLKYDKVAEIASKLENNSKIYYKEFKDWLCRDLKEEGEKVWGEDVLDVILRPTTNGFAIYVQTGDGKSVTTYSELILAEKGYKFKTSQIHSIKESDLFNNILKIKDRLKELAPYIETKVTTSSQKLDMKQELDGKESKNLLFEIDISKFLQQNNGDFAKFKEVFIQILIEYKLLHRRTGESIDNYKYNNIC